MNGVVKLKRTLLLVGDLAALYAALFLMLALRYGTVRGESLELHFLPFSALFLVWVAVFYLGDLYDLRVVKDSVEATRRLGQMLALCGLIAILFFYLVPGLPITPKTNLFLFLVLAGALDFAWRRLFSRHVAVKLPATRLLVLGANRTVGELVAYLEAHPQLGYEVALWLREGLHDAEFGDLATLISRHKIHALVVPAHVKKSARAARIIYKNLILGVEVVELAALYEAVFKKVPLAELEEVWFLEHLARDHRLYDAIKRPVEVALVALVLLATLPLTLLGAMLVRLTSRGKPLFRQRRVGARGKEMVIHKLRTMRADAERGGPRWAAPRDPRAIPVGKFLRRTHLDEFPQLWDVLQGGLSLVGPRPERPEFVELLRKEVPFYDLRHLIRPGITGWAQTHYRYGASVEDAYEKLQYDIYYLKHRSPLLDLLILLKTVKFFFTTL